MLHHAIHRYLPLSILSTHLTGYTHMLPCLLYRYLPLLLVSYHLTRIHQYVLAYHPYTTLGTPHHLYTPTTATTVYQYTTTTTIATYHTTQVQSIHTLLLLDDLTMSTRIYINTYLSLPIPYPHPSQCTSIPVLQGVYITTMLPLSIHLVHSLQLDALTMSIPSYPHGIPTPSQVPPTVYRIHTCQLHPYHPVHAHTRGTLPIPSYQVATLCYIHT